MASLHNSCHDQGSGYANGDCSFNVDNLNLTNPFQLQPNLASQVEASMVRTRHDSVNSQASSQARQVRGSRQAEQQPYGQQLTPFGTAYSTSSADMSRGTSHASYLSSNSSGQQGGSEATFVQNFPYSNNPLPTAVGMQRSRTSNSPLPPFPSYQPHRQSNIPQTYPPPTSFYGPGLTNEFTGNTSTTQLNTDTVSTNNIFDFDTSGLNGADYLGSGTFGHE